MIYIREQYLYQQTTMRTQLEMRVFSSLTEKPTFWHLARLKFLFNYDHPLKQRESVPVGSRRCKTAARGDFPPLIDTWPHCQVMDLILINVFKKEASERDPLLTICRLVTSLLLLRSWATFYFDCAALSSILYFRAIYQKFHYKCESSNLFVTRKKDNIPLMSPCYRSSNESFFDEV